MWEWLNASVMKFKHCFARPATFGWFAIILVGLMIRSDHLGVTSIVRELSLRDNSYVLMLHFFRSEGWYILRLQRAWLDMLIKSGLLVTEAGRYILIGDGVKQSKEGRRMPGVKRLHQESGNSSKGEYIHGHHFGGIGVLAGNGIKTYSIPVSARMHEGISSFQKWLHGDEYNEESHVVKTIRDAARAAVQLGASILLLDALYLSVPMLKALALIPFLDIVTKAKSNCVAYFYPGPYKGLGAKPKKGADVKVSDFFRTLPHAFTHTEMFLYGKTKKVSYFCIDLKWGKGLYRDLRFVLTVMEGVRSILVSTDLTLTPVQIINLYNKRFKIECTFRELKQVVGGFTYRFWSKAMPKLKKYKSNDVNRAMLDNVSAPTERKRIESAVNAIEGFVQISLMALGFLQLIGLLFGKEINRSGKRFMRTVSNETPSERTVADYLRKNIYMLFRFFPNLAITSIISARQHQYPDDSNESAA